MSILGQVGQRVGAEVKALGDRLTILEGGTPTPPASGLTVAPVTWRNLSEINLSGEKLTNGDFSQTESVQDPSFTLPTSPNAGHANNHTFAEADRPLVEDLQTGNTYRMHVLNVNSGNARLHELDGAQIGWVVGRGTKWEVVRNVPANWTLKSGTLDADKLAQGIVKGVGAEVRIEQMLAAPIPAGANLVAKVERTDTAEAGTVHIQALRANGTPFGSNKHIAYAPGFVEFAPEQTMWGFRLVTAHGSREAGSVSLFQGEVAGGTVQAYTGGGLEKISGPNGWNAGASTVESIPGNAEGYVQFQWATAGKSVKAGLAYADEDFADVEPFGLTINGNGHVYADGFPGEAGWAEQGDWFRIRHDPVGNAVRFQRREPLYTANAELRAEGYAVSDNSDLGFFVAFHRAHNLGNVDGEPVAVTLGRGYEIAGWSAASNSLKIADDNGADVWLKLASDTAARVRGDEWEFAEQAGEDYVTFHAHPTTTNGTDLLFDASFFHVGARLNDVQLAK